MESGRQRIVLGDFSDKSGNALELLDSELLFVVPRKPASSWPVLDELTRKMTAALRLADPDPFDYEGVHECICGTSSTHYDYFLQDGQMTNSLCIHYLAYHREEVPDMQLTRVRQLAFGEQEPLEDELWGIHEALEKRFRAILSNPGEDAREIHIKLAERQQAYRERRQEETKQELKAWITETL